MSWSPALGRSCAGRARPVPFVRFRRPASSRPVRSASIESRRQAVLDGQVIELTPHEFDVLHLLASNAGIVFTREMLLERVWTNDTHVTVRSVDTLIKRLRQKLEADTRDPKLILTVWGTGYKYVDG